jgi:hypothetical protein
MKSLIRFSLCVTAAAVAYAGGAFAEAPNIYAIRGARIVTAAGAPIASGTLVIRNGIIEAVGADVQPPADAMVIDGAGMTVYPGLIDMGTAVGVDVLTAAQPATFRTTEDQERYKSSTIFRPDLVVANHLQQDSTDLARFAGSGITTVLSTPPGSLVRGQSALVNVAIAPDEPQIGSVADSRRGLNVVKTPVALHVSLGAAGGRGGYPVSLLGSIAFVRQHFLDAQHQLLEQQHYEKSKTASERPTYDPALDALQPALARRLPVAFEADLSREILRSLNLSKQFNLDPVITGAREADQVADALKASNARVIYNLNYPTRPRTLAPDADEPIRSLRGRAQASRRPRRSRGRACCSRSRRMACVSRGSSSATPRARSRTACPPTPRSAR